MPNTYLETQTLHILIFQLSIVSSTFLKPQTQKDPGRIELNP